MYSNASYIGERNLNRKIDIYYQNLDASGNPSDADFSVTYTIFDGSGQIYTDNMTKISPFPGFYYAGLTPSTGLGFAKDKNYLIRTECSEGSITKVDLQHFRLVDTIPYQIFNANPNDYEGEENFAEDILQIQSVVNNLPSGVWNYNLYGPESYGTSDAAYLLRDVREFVLNIQNLTTTMDLRLDTGRAEQLDSIPTILSRQATIYNEISGVSSKIGEPETTLAEDISNVPAEAATYVWSSVFDENPGPNTSLDFIVATYNNTTGIQSKVNNIPSGVWDYNLYGPESYGTTDAAYLLRDVREFVINVQDLTTTMDLRLDAGRADQLDSIPTILSRQLSIMSGVDDVKDYIGVSGENLASIPYNVDWSSQIEQDVSDALAASSTLKKDVTYSITTSNGTMDVTYGDT